MANALTHKLTLTSLANHGHGPNAQFLGGGYRVSISGIPQGEPRADLWLVVARSSSAAASKTVPSNAIKLTPLLVHSGTGSEKVVTLKAVQLVALLEVINQASLWGTDTFSKVIWTDA